MATWLYKAKDARGKIEEGTIEAPSRDSAMRQLRAQKLRVMNIKSHSDSYFSRVIVRDSKGQIQIQLGGGYPSIKELAVFTKQCSIMIERGIPLVQCLGILANQQKSIVFSRALQTIRTMVENGSSFSAALSRYPKIFDELYIAMVRSGEASGTLDNVLKEIVKFLEKSAKLRSQLKSASIYPGLILFTAISVTYAILVFLVPVFASMYTEAGKELPELTQLVIDTSDFLSAYMIHLFVAVICIFVGLKNYYKTPQGKIHLDGLMLNLPLVGEVIRKIAVGRFSSTMATMLSSGVSILDSLTICAQSAGNKKIEEFVLRVREKIVKGATFAGPLSEGGLIPDMVVSMIAVGEQTGAIDQTLTKVAEIYEDEVDTAVSNMTASLQPILIIGIGGVLGFVIIALYLPIFDTASLAG